MVAGSASRPPRIPAALRVPAMKAARVLKRAGVTSGQRVLVALSGGPDSVLLLHVLSLLAPRVGFSLVAVHINHALGDAAPRMEAVAQEAARALSVPFASHAVTVEHAGEGLEGAARRARHAQLARAVETHGAQWIALGHTATDAAETFLQRVLEGAGRGQGALPECDGNRLRPLLALTRGEVRQAVAAAGLPSVDDPMNDDPALLRGYFRARLWPLLEGRFGAPDRTLARAAALAREDHQALEVYARQAWSVDVGADREQLRGIPRAVVTRALRQMVESVVGAPVRTGGEAVHKAAEAAVRRGGPARSFKVGPAWLVVERSHVRACLVSGSHGGPSPSEREGEACYPHKVSGPERPGKAG